MSDDVDYVEVGRKAHELSERHGALAFHYASKLAAEAANDPDKREHLFWKAVASSLQPR